jgi:hypothetical protein
VRTLGIVLVGLALLVLANLWVRQGALITLSCQVAMAVPPVPALAALLLMLPAARLLRRVGSGRREIIAVYCFLTLAVALTSGAAMRFFLPSLPTPFYFATPENNWAEFHDLIPTWLAPRDADVVRDYFEGSDTGAVPWGPWLRPLGAWMFFFVAFYGLLMCIILIFRPVWEEDEHLAYPMAELPLMLAGYRKEARGLWLNGGFWIGFGLICVHTLLNILNAFNPAVTALGLETNLGNLLHEHPLTALRPLVFRYRPLILGIGYMMPSDIVVSTLLFYFVYLKGLQLGGAMAGVSVPRFPLYREQSTGAFVGMALILIYGARARIAEVFSRLAGRGEGSPVLPAATVACAAAVYLFWRAAGMAPAVILAYFGVMIAFALSYARGRAETGYPHHWIKPLDQERNVLINFIGTRALAPRGDMRTLSLLSTTHFLSRGYLPQLIAFPMESFRIAREVKIPLRRMLRLMVLAVILGTMVSWWMHISAFYQYGANVLEGGTTSGGQRVALMRSSYDALAGWSRAPEGPNPNEMTATGAGLVIVLVLAALRRAFVGFPLHPMGFLFSLTGAGENGWPMLLLVTIVRTIVLRIGGMRLYRQVLPFFIGVIVGHFFAAGFAWSLIASFGGEGFNKYPVWF